MLQQTTVPTVVAYYERWIKIFPKVKTLAQAPLQKILKAWQGLGYYQRAKNLHKAAQIIATEYQGKLPATLRQLEQLPGFGPYTAGAVASIAFDLPYPIIDANIRRVAMRLLEIVGYADPSHDNKIRAFLQKIIPKKNAGTFNQALMELGALVCRNREPLCLRCPIKTHCHAYEKGTQEIIPQPKKRIIKDLNAAVGILRRNGKYFIQRRPSTGLLADLWEFPGGKIEKGEEPQEALRRELKEELDIEITSAKHLMNVRHFYTQFRVNLHVFECELRSYPELNEYRKWSSLYDLQRYPMPSGSAKIVDKLIADIM